MKSAIVVGAGGFIGGHLVARLLAEGYSVRAADVKPFSEWWQVHNAASNLPGFDCSDPGTCRAACHGGADEVYQLAADMGGMGFIEANKARCMLSVLTNTNMLVAARDAKVGRFFYSSSACVYRADRQNEPDVAPLREFDAYPAMPEDGYGWEKLFSERMCRHFSEDFGLETRVARFHNVYGPCFDEATEILTRDGWTAFYELRNGDEVATLNQKTGQMEFQVPTARQAYWYEGPMYRSRTNAVDLAVTPDHALWISTPTTGKKGKHVKTPWSRVLAKDAKWTRARMQFTCKASWKGKTPPSVFHLPEQLDKAGRSLANRGGNEKHIPIEVWLRFVGWFVSEGCSFVTPSNHTVNISQNAGPKQDEIVATIKAMGFKCYVNGKNVVVSSIQLWNAVQVFGRGARRKSLPKWYLNLPPKHLSVLWDSLFAGDGDKDGGRYNTTSEVLADQIQEIALKLGHRAIVRHERRKDGLGIFRVFVSDRTRLDTKRHHRWIEPYAGMVYDVTVPNHVIMVRRNGKPMWSGNCGTWTGGREKAPAAICRKVAEAIRDGTGEIEVWGDGTQTRSFMFIDDCVEGIRRIMDSDFRDPVNLGSSEMVSVNELVHTVERIAGVLLAKRYKLDAPRGVMGRSSDNSMILDRLGWEPRTSLRSGLELTYRWVKQQVG